MGKVKSWCRANAMLVISLLAAVVTAFFVPPDRDYLGYYDLKTLACLFCVLAVVGALRDLHIFSALSQRMVHTFSTVRGVCTALVVITMFGSMLLTNDTALLTFLPLGWFVLSSTGQEKHTALLFILQNCAANLCGMITPFGNPQNLYLFSYYGIPAGTFFSVMLPPFILSTVLILLCCLLFPKDRLTVPEAQVVVDRRRAVVYGGLFCLAVAMVLRLIPYGPGLAVIVLALWFLDRHALKTVDWGLLATFAAFFTFSGNLARMEPVRMLFVRLLSHGTMLISALTCQIISNVPAAILLSRFTQDAHGLLVGVNIERWWPLWPASSPSGNTPAAFPAAPNAFSSCFPPSASLFWQFFWLPCPFWAEQPGPERRKTKQLPQVSEKIYFCGTVSKVVKVNAGSFVEELAAKGYCNPTQFEAVILRRGPAKASRL